MQPLISIGLPTFNRADNYFKLALESALAQSYPDFEVIVADNASTDGTRELVAGYDDARLRYFRHQPGLHYNENFNFCLSQARGEYFQLLHDDDLIDPTFLQRCAEAFAGRDPVGIVRTGVRTIDANGSVLQAFPNEDEGLNDLDFVRRWLDGRSMLICCSTLFNTAELRAQGGFQSEKDLFQDVVAELTLAKRRGRVDVREPLASFRKHDAQTTNANKVGDWCDDSVFLLRRLQELYGADAEDLYDKGLIHFTKHCYDLARAIPNAVERYQAYYAVYERFERRLSPFAYFSRRAVREFRTQAGIRRRAAARILTPQRRGESGPA